MSIESVVDEENSDRLSGVHDVGCYAGEMSVVWMQNQLWRNQTRGRMLEYVNELCDLLLSPMGGSTVDCL